MQASLQRERAASQEVAAQVAPATLRLERVVLAESGTLLILWSNPDGNVWRLRQAYAQRFPGVPSMFH